MQQGAFSSTNGRSRQLIDIEVPSITGKYGSETVYQDGRPKPRLLHVNGWDMDQSKRLNYTSNCFFLPKMHSDHFPGKFGLN